MGGKKSTSSDPSTSKRAAGQARKAAAASAKQAARDAAVESAEAEKWKQGARETGKAEAAKAKAQEAARKKAERDRLLAEEEGALKGAKAGAGGAKKAEKRVRGSTGLDEALGALGSARNGKEKELHASGIDDALDALAITSASNGTAEQIERHPERRFRAAYAAYEQRRLEEMKDDTSLRRNQKIEAIRKEFDKQPDNPFNQVSARYNASRDEMREIREKEREKVEGRLASGQGQGTS